MRQIHDSLRLIDIDQPLEGFRKFIGAWVCRVDGTTLLVDPGPAATIPRLAEQLRQDGIGRVDHVLLTHIHLDHAGGTGHFLRHFPEARVNCHPRGIPHLTAPQKLWEESKKVLGKVAEAYGEMEPVPEASIAWRERIPAGGGMIEAIETPGHAAHHVSYRVGDILFAGEVCGVYVPLDGGFYCRPATPPPFRHGTFRNSITRVEALGVKLVCIGHYGSRQDVAEVFERARRQLDFWVETAERHFRAGSDPFEEAVLAELIANDPDMARWTSLPEDIRARERYFCFNSIRGIRMYLEKEKGNRARR
ncbi:MAG: MBL fold metallo-hydrolase [Pseudomonadota bacterium]|jgi:glyoxylase-like metal-dependent hydrolase (beta-lactamase superfamily II)|nr:MBL fold metallo-hydrolase [Pseudomonadota bacterium]NLX31208.1 MBL fold metallo-hydrolase [Deltaproteobacteria bacterium]HNU85796.1 MBL fold metallo-hydrolase [Syntrophales bacterium]HNZ35028.1 MBL fold metallo-hydrolase [Syntrophales bacterium]HOF74189.1 MBL fold metallo-hydrolase [Syntrophales bacterium]